VAHQLYMSLFRRQKYSCEVIKSMSGIFTQLSRRFHMDMLNASGSHNSEPASKIITTLYDLITEIEAGQGNQPKADIGYDIDRPNKHGQTGSVIERVAHMFESGQIKFRNTQDIKRKYAELFIDNDLTSQ
jgi:hypothetical protein